MGDLDRERVARFGERMTGILNGGMLSLMTSIGHQTGLFEVMATLEPETSDRIAAVAGLNERYVREWLDTMVAGRIVDYSPNDRTYVLPAEHAALLTRAAGPENLAVLAQTVPLLAEVHKGIVHSFRRGGGVFYDQFQEFMAVWASLNEKRFENTLVSRIVPLRAEIARALEAGIDVLEIGCGEGHSTNLLAAAYPRSRFTGYEFRREAVEEAAAKAASLGSTNVTFSVKDITQLEERAAYDLALALDVIHDQARPRLVLRNVARALKHDGVFLMADIRASSEVHENLDHPMAPFLYATSVMHCMTVSLALDGEGLGTMWGEQKARKLLSEAGFSSVEVKQIEGDIFNNYYIARKA
jgi:2-polyprenyl-3-methyl-5-hydroxy-6-metoxy-1,4-benzoquinol methylase